MSEPDPDDTRRALDVVARTLLPLMYPTGTYVSQNVADSFAFAHFVLGALEANDFCVYDLRADEPTP